MKLPRRVWMNEDGVILYSKPQGGGWVELVPAANFEAIYGNQEDLAVKFSGEIAQGARPDPVAILEMAEQLYRAEVMNR